MVEEEEEEDNDDELCVQQLMKKFDEEDEGCVLDLNCYWMNVSHGGKEVSSGWLIKV